MNPLDMSYDSHILPFFVVFFLLRLQTLNNLCTQLSHRIGVLACSRKLAQRGMKRCGNLVRERVGIQLLLPRLIHIH